MRTLLRLSASDGVNVDGVGLVCGVQDELGVDNYLLELVGNLTESCGGAPFLTSASEVRVCGGDGASCELEGPLEIDIQYSADCAEGSLGADPGNPALGGGWYQEGEGRFLLQLSDLRVRISEGGEDFDVSLSRVEMYGLRGSDGAWHPVVLGGVLPVEAVEEMCVAAFTRAFPDATLQEIDAARASVGMGDVMTGSGECMGVSMGAVTADP